MPTYDIVICENDTLSPDNNDDEMIITMTMIVSHISLAASGADNVNDSNDDKMIIMMTI